MDNVGVGETLVGCAAAPCVDITFNVSAAAVYKESKVASGWGAAGVNRLQASVMPIVINRSNTLPKRDKDIRASDSFIDQLLGRTGWLYGSRVYNKKRTLRKRKPAHLIWAGF